MVIEKYSHVMHLVSNVRGKLQDGVNSIDALKSSFPSGTVSGAPKIRAIEIIDDLENTRREIYAGAVGYIGFSGNLDTCIAIRTLLVKDGIAYAQAGAGIVSDSTPSQEYEETINKASVLLEAINLANKGEVPMPVKLKITYQDGSSEDLTLPVEIWQRGDTWSHLVETDKAPKSIEIDPDKILPDVDYSNDSWPGESFYQN